VQVQNKLNLATPLLPQEVQQQGIRVTKAVKNFLLVIGLVSEDGSMTKDDLANYIVSNMQDPISRTAGVGDFQVFGAQYAMRIWLDPAKLNKFQLTPVDVAPRCRAERAGVVRPARRPAGPAGHPAQRHHHRQDPPADRRAVRKDPAQGQQRRLPGAPGRCRRSAWAARTTPSAPSSTASRPPAWPWLATGANALDTAKALRKTINELEPFFPPGVKAVFPYDTTPVVTESISGVVHTLIEAVVLVFLVMYLFLQNFRAT
jgi:multidrug efflux pump